MAKIDFKSVDEYLSSRFPLSQPVPVKLIGRIAKFRAKEVAELKKAKAAAQKKD